jgi:hypothetical protein
MGTQPTTNPTSPQSPQHRTIPEGQSTGQSKRRQPMPKLRRNQPARSTPHHTTQQRRSTLRPEQPRHLVPTMPRPTTATTNHKTKSPIQQTNTHRNMKPRFLDARVHTPALASRELNVHGKKGREMATDSAVLPAAWLPTEKRCTNCSAWLPLEDFPANRRSHLGRGSWCRQCARAATRDWRRRNRERENAERRAAYREQHPLPERPCAVCGRVFAKRPDAIVCGERCRNRRKRRDKYPSSRRSASKLEAA